MVNKAIEMEADPEVRCEVYVCMFLRVYVCDGLVEVNDLLICHVMLLNI